MRTLLISFILSLITASAWGSGKVTLTEANGPISIGLGVGYGNQRLLNTDGSWSSYRGTSYLGSLEIHLFNFDSSSMTLFGDYSFSSGKDSSDQTSSLDHSAFNYGLRFYPAGRFFLGVGFGSSTEKTTTAGVNNSLTHTATKIGLGYDWSIGGSWSLGLQGYYKTGPVPLKDNPSLSSNSSFDSLEGYVVLLWSPQVLNIITGH